MKVLVIGGGGREHALIWKLLRSRHISKVFCWPGNAGIAEIVECIDVSPQNIEALVDFVKYEWVDLTIVCSENRQSAEILEVFERNGCRLFGLDRKALPIASSRVASKNFLRRHRMPIPEYRVFSSHLQARDYVRLKGLPAVIKTDGYPGEDGVFAVSSLEEVDVGLTRIAGTDLSEAASGRIIIEEHIEGNRMSLLSITDGTRVAPIALICKVRDVSADNRASISKAFGACTVTTSLTEHIVRAIAEDILQPLISALNGEGIQFKGFLSTDLVRQGEKTMLLEVQFCFGDLEPQTVMPVLKSDIGELILSASAGGITEAGARSGDEAAVCVSLMSSDVTPDSATARRIRGLESLRDKVGIFVFHEHTYFDDGHINTTGGTALTVTGMGKDLPEARAKVYASLEGIRFEGMRYRDDICTLSTSKERKESI